MRSYVMHVPLLLLRVRADAPHLQVSILKPGRGTEDKRGDSTHEVALSKCWLYLCGRSIVCSRHQEVRMKIIVDSEYVSLFALNPPKILTSTILVRFE